MARLFADLHTHVVDAHDIVVNPKISYFGGREFRGLFQENGSLAEAVLCNPIDKITLEEGSIPPEGFLVGLINFDDERARKILEELKLNSKKRGNFKLTGDLGRAISLGDCFYFISGEEVATELGHVLIIGNEKPVKLPKARPWGI